MLEARGKLAWIPGPVLRLVLQSVTEAPDVRQDPARTALSEHSADLVQVR